MLIESNSLNSVEFWSIGENHIDDESAASCAVLGSVAHPLGPIRKDPPTGAFAYPKYASIARWCEITGMSRTSTYYALGRKDLRAIKLGNRTLVDVEQGLSWLSCQPAAEIRAPRSL